VDRHVDPGDWLSRFRFYANARRPCGSSGVVFGLFPLSFIFWGSELDRDLFTGCPQSCFFRESTKITG
jgi:hypothetical protein